MRVIIAAAGTGGHINPGIAIANKIKKEQPDSEIIFVGTTRGLENDLVPKAGYELRTIEAYGLSKKISIQNMKNMIKTVKGLGQAKKIVEDFKPDLVIGMGGYICGAVITAAHKAKIPTMLHESNAYPGRAVKMLSKKVDTIMVAFEDTKKNLEKCGNVVVTGTPTKVRDLKLTKEQKEEKIKELGFTPINPVILVFGGSQGAQKINEVVGNIIKNDKYRIYQVIWATGPKQYDVIKEEFAREGKDIENIKGVKVLPYIYNIEEMWNIADVVVCRSGAITVTEAAIVGKPTIFIPLPSVGKNRQYDNAAVLEKLGAAKIILNEDVNSPILNQIIENICYYDVKLKKMGDAARKIAFENAEERIYSEIQKLLENNKN